MEPDAGRRLRARRAISCLTAVIGLSLFAAACGSGLPNATAVGSSSSSRPAPATAPGTAAVTTKPGKPSPTTPGLSTGPAGPTQAAPGSQAAPATRGPTPQPSPAVGPAPVPADLRPPLSDAAADAPIIYSDGCHLGFLAVVPPPCEFGTSGSPTTVVLVGDSKAAQWFPALALLAGEHGWRLISLTKSACTAADVTVWSGALGRAYSECDAWRRNVIARVRSEHSALVVVSDDRLYQLAINGGPVPLARRPDVWDAGLEKTLRQLRAEAADVVLLGDTPRSRYDVPACLTAHLTDASACATPLARAIDQARLSRDQTVADAAGARFTDPTQWVCPSDPCPAIIGSLLVYRGQDHLTGAFIESLAPRLADALRVP